MYGFGDRAVKNPNEIVFTVYCFVGCANNSWYIWNRPCAVEDQLYFITDCRAAPAIEFLISFSLMSKHRYIARVSGERSSNRYPVSPSLTMVASPRPVKLLPEYRKLKLQRPPYRNSHDKTE